MSQQQQNILVVDDDSGVRLTLEGIIDDEGFNFVGAEDGVQAVELATKSSFDLILMDIKMPGINGVEAYKEIKRVNPCPVVVMMTGFAVEGLIEEALQEGAHAVVYKPFQTERIIDLVRSFLNTKRVLLVDDPAADRATLRAILEDDGYEVHEAADGPQALTMVSERHCTVILMDINMPGMDGLSALEQIKTLDPQAEIVFVSGHAMDDTAITGLLSGAHTALTKPVDIEELLAYLRSVTGRENTA